MWGPGGDTARASLRPGILWLEAFQTEMNGFERVPRRSTASAPRRLLHASEVCAIESHLAERTRLSTAGHDAACGHTCTSCHRKTRRLRAQRRKKSIPLPLTELPSARTGTTALQDACQVLPRAGTALLRNAHRNQPRRWSLHDTTPQREDMKCPDPH
jgi:hypothetical protein